MVMGVENLIQLCTWAYAVYGVHPNVKRHNGGGVSFGYMIVHCKPNKQKLDTKSSTEAKGFIIID